MTLTLDRSSADRGGADLPDDGLTRGPATLADRELAALAAPRRARVLPHGWPLIVAFAGYPLWWVLGIAPFVVILSAIPLGIELARRDSVKAPRGFGLWLLFLAWVLMGVLVLQVSAPEAIPGVSYGRYGIFLFRLAWLTAATVMLLYIGNMRRELTMLWFCRAIGAMFIVCVAGGLLGTFFPRLQFPSALELLTGGMGKAPFLQSLIHPSAAQIQDFLGYEQGRPSAPFPFTNQWGLNTAVSMPFFVVGWFHQATRSRRVVGAVVLALSVIPIVWSLNRGLWLALLVCAAVLAVRAALQGKPGALIGGLVAVGIAATIILASPLGALVATRLDNGNSNQGRTNLGTQTLVSTVQGSPVVGFGTTRDPAGNWVSIAAGSTAQCPRCTPPPLGTQGQFWFILFATGIGGALLYFGFLISQAVKTLPTRNIYATAGGAALTMHLVTAPFYNSMDVSLVVIMASVGLMWRARLHEAGEAAGALEVPLGRYRRLMRRHWVFLTLAVLLGAAVGTGLQALEGTPVEAHQRVYVRDIRNGDTDSGAELAQIDFSLDTEAMIMRSELVLDAIRESADITMTDAEALSRLRVTALPNTRVLVVHVTMPNERAAVLAAQSASTAYLQERSRILNAGRTEQLTTLRTRAEAVSALTPDLVARLPEVKYRLAVVKETLAALQTKARSLDTTSNRLTNNALDVGRLVGSTSAEPIQDGWVIKAASGAAIAFLLGVALSTLLDGSTQRVTARRWLRRRAEPGLPILALVTDPHDLHRAELAVRSFGPIDSVLAPFHDEQAAAVAEELDDRLWRSPRTPAAHGTSSQAAALPRVVLTVTSRTRSLDIRSYRQRAWVLGVDPVGLVIVEA